MPDLQISFEQENEFGVWQGITPPFVSDRKLRIKVQLENKSSMPMERVLVVSESLKIGWMTLSSLLGNSKEVKKAFGFGS